MARRTRATPSAPSVNVRVGGALFAALRGHAEREGVSTSRLIGEVLSVWLSKRKPRLNVIERRNPDDPHIYEEAGNSPAAGMIAEQIGAWPCRICGDHKEARVHTDMGATVAKG